MKVTELMTLEGILSEHSAWQVENQSLMKHLWYRLDDIVRYQSIPSHWTSRGSLELGGWKGAVFLGYRLF